LTVRSSAKSAGSGSATLKLRHALPRGRFTIRVIAVDVTGNRSAPAILRRPR
jgi:hypothetical protein